MLSSRVEETVIRISCSSMQEAGLFRCPLRHAAMLLNF